MKSTFAVLLFSILIISALKVPAMGGTTDSTKAKYLYQKAKKLFNEADFDSAYGIFKDAAMQYKLEPNWEEQADVYNFLSGIAWKMRIMDEAKAYCDTSVSILVNNNADTLHKLYAKAYHNYGTIELLNGHLKTAVTFYEKAIAINELVPNTMETNLNNNYNNIGIA